MTRTGISGIDHILIAVRDLVGAGQSWQRLGFTLSPRGVHLGRGTANLCIMFERDYLELLGVVEATEGSAHFAEFLKSREGPMKLAWGTRDAHVAAETLAVYGFHPSEVTELRRQIELPEGSDVLKFGKVSLAPEETPGLDCFLCAAMTPKKMRRPEWLQHPNGAVGIAGITVAVEDPQALIIPYEYLFGPGNLHTTDDVVTLHVGRHRIIFATADDVTVLHPEIEPPAQSAVPSIALVQLETADIDRTADHLARFQVEHEQIAGRAIVVPAEATAGTNLEFVAAR